MSNDKVSTRPTDVFTATVRGRKTGAKNPENKRTLYLPLPRETVQALRFEEGEILTIGILKRMPPLWKQEPDPETPPSVSTGGNVK